jgi:hypothetical protein
MYVCFLQVPSVGLLQDDPFWHWPDIFTQGTGSTSLSRTQSCCGPVLQRNEQQQHTCFAALKCSVNASRSRVSSSSSMPPVACNNHCPPATHHRIAILQATCMWGYGLAVPPAAHPFSLSVLSYNTFSQCAYVHLLQLSCRGLRSALIEREDFGSGTSSTHNLSVIAAFHRLTV